MEGFPPALGSDTPVAVAIRRAQPQFMGSTEDLPDTAYRSPEHRVAVQTSASARCSRSDGRSRANARRAHLRLAEPRGARARRLAARPADHAPRGAGARQQRALPGSARRARAAGGAHAAAAARRDHRRDHVAQGAVHEPAGAGAARSWCIESARSRARTPSLSTARWRASPRPAARSTSSAGDGSRGLISLSAEPVRDAGGEIVAAVATLFDLTEHRQREEALAFLAEASVVPHRDARSAAHAQRSWSSSQYRGSPTGAASTCSTTARSATSASPTPIRPRRAWARPPCMHGGRSGHRCRAACRPLSARGVPS